MGDYISSSMDEVLKQYDPLGNSRKYPYHTMDGFLEFWGQGAFFEPQIQRHGGEGILMIGIPKAWRGF